MEYNLGDNVIPTSSLDVSFSVYYCMSRAELSQLIHDLKTPLSIISMGVEALKNVRYDGAQFDVITKMIAEEGIKPLNAMIDSLGDNEDLVKPDNF